MFALMRKPASRSSSAETSAIGGRLGRLSRTIHSLAAGCNDTDGSVEPSTRRAISGGGRR